MIVAQWSCEVDSDKWDQFIRFVKNEMRLLFKFYGCSRHELSVSLPTGRLYFPYQSSLQNNEYIERLYFRDLRSFERFMRAIQQDPQAYQLIRRRESEFGVRNQQFMILAQI